MQIIVHKQILLTSLYFWRKSAQLDVYCTFLFKEIVHLHHFIGKSQEGEQIIFMDIRVLLYANNRTETYFSDVPLFL